jgi:hypothetical protein
MNLSRPSSRQVAAYQQLLRDCEQAAARIPSRRELEARRDNYLASLR